MFRHLCTAVALYFLLDISSAQTVQWLTRPGQNTIPLTIEKNILPASNTREYLFLAPLVFGGPWYGPHIYDSSGHLVWYGGGVTQNEAFNLHVSPYQGTDKGTHLVFSDGVGYGYTTGVNRFVNQSYDVVASYGSRNKLPGPDLHETNVVANVPGPSNSLIYDIYNIVRKNIAAFGGPTPGYIVSGCFQDVDLTSNKTVFQWCSGEHIPFNESYTPPGQAGGGYQYDPWDYFHLNAVDKSPEGDYLISARHTSTIYKVAGARSKNPGSVIWRLGGKNNMFTMQPSTFNFTFQHHIRYHGMNGKLAMYSLFDNGNNGTGKSSTASSGMYFTIDETNMVATLVHQYVEPQGQLGEAMGSMQILDNNNVFIGWGSVPYISEHSQDGTVLFYAHVGPQGQDILSYRSYKYPWVGKPSTKPDILAYRQTCNATQSYVYVSWNGATEVAAYTVAFANQANAKFVQYGGKVAKRSYETAMPIKSTPFKTYAQVTAYDSSGTMLGKSLPRAIFVPQPGNAACSNKNCGTSFDYSNTNSVASTCVKS